jgi:hypothetical protein
MWRTQTTSRSGDGGCRARAPPAAIATPPHQPSCSPTTCCPRCSHRMAVHSPGAAPGRSQSAPPTPSPTHTPFPSDSPAPRLLPRWFAAAQRHPHLLRDVLRPRRGRRDCRRGAAAERVEPDSAGTRRGDPGAAAGGRAATRRAASPRCACASTPAAQHATCAVDVPGFHRTAHLLRAGAAVRERGGVQATLW